MPVVLVSMRVVEAQGYLEYRDALAQDWCRMASKIGLLPVPMLNAPEMAGTYLEELTPDAVILSGGDDLQLAGPPEYRPGEENPYVLRDYFEYQILDLAIQKGIPVLGVCRGMQLINSFFGGHTIDVSDVCGTANAHVAVEHEVQLNLHNGPLGECAIKVNSYHNRILLADCLGQGIMPFATIAEDGSVEGFRHKRLPVSGIMWHPERPNPDNSCVLDLVQWLLAPDTWPVVDTEEAM